MKNFLARLFKKHAKYRLMSTTASTFHDQIYYVEEHLMFGIYRLVSNTTTPTYIKARDSFNFITCYGTAKLHKYFDKVIKESDY